MYGMLQELLVDTHPGVRERKRGHPDAKEQTHARTSSTYTTIMSDTPPAHDAGFGAMQTTVAATAHAQLPPSEAASSPSSPVSARSLGSRCQHRGCRPARGTAA